MSDVSDILESIESSELDIDDDTPLTREELDEFQRQVFDE